MSRYQIAPEQCFRHPVIRVELDPDAFATAWADGRRLTTDEAVALALSA